VFSLNKNTPKERLALYEKVRLAQQSVKGGLKRLLGR
jgi:hypothetical protein